MDKKYEAQKFLQVSYNRSDSWAKELFIKYLIRKGYSIASSEETFDHDIKAYNKKGKLVYFELETKTGFPFKNRPTFPFDSVSFTGRKEKLHLLNEFYYVIICRETNWAVTCSSSVIFQKEFTEELYIESSERDGLDKFYRVPKEQCIFFSLK